ncbi:MAG: hypothetical protein ACR2OW_07345 [Methyloligellaceae bacterium]
MQFGIYLLCLGISIAGATHIFEWHSAFFVLAFFLVLGGMYIFAGAMNRALKRRSVAQVMPSEIPIGERTERVIAAEPTILAAKFAEQSELLEADEIALGQQALWLTMLASALSDGVIEHRQALAVYGIYQKITGVNLSQEEVINAAQSATENEAGSLQELENISTRLHTPLKPLILEAAYLVLAADKYVSQVEIDKLTEIAQSLGMSRNDYLEQLKSFRSLGSS